MGHSHAGEESSLALMLVTVDDSATVIGGVPTQQSDFRREICYLREMNFLNVHNFMLKSIAIAIGDLLQQDARCFPGY